LMRCTSAWPVNEQPAQITQITEISLTWDHKSSFFHSEVVRVWGLRPWTPLGDFCPPDPLDLLPPETFPGYATVCDNNRC